MRKSALSIALIIAVFAGAANARLAANGFAVFGMSPATGEAQTVDMPSLQQLASQPLAR